MALADGRIEGPRPGRPRRPPRARPHPVRPGRVADDGIHVSAYARLRRGARPAAGGRPRGRHHPAARRGRHGRDGPLGLRREARRPTRRGGVPPGGGRGGRLSLLPDEWGVGRRMPADGGLYYDSFGAAAGRRGRRGDDRRLRVARPDRPRPLRGHGRGGAADRRGRGSGRLRRLDLRRAHRGPVQAAGLRGRLHGPRRGARARPAGHGADPRDQARLLGSRPAASWATSWTWWARPTTSAARTGPLFSPATYRSLVKPLQRELFSFIRARTSAPDLPPQLWGGPRADPGPDRGRRRHPQPRAGLRRRHGRRGAQARVRARPRVLGRRRRHPARAGRRHARRGPRARSCGAWTTCAPAAGSCSPRSTTSSPTCPPRTSSPCGPR